ncbi:MAG: tape measure protein [Propioniciclava sp.]|uniref:tape measure protein n=1 Tax=Propioniciclava sp. TaxID=2038686 RepID=UPI0039E3052B
MATEIGTAFLSIVASTKGMAKDIRKAFGEAEDVASKSGKGSGQGFLSGIKGTLLKAGAVVGVGALVGKTISLGMQRAIAIEGSQKKLEGLGHSASSISSIMDSALKSVRGTAYGLGDAASVAAMMAAAGVKNGDAMTRTLSTVADVAAISGRSLTDMGTIFGSVAARGKLQGDDLLQLMSSGIPVLQMLGQHLGKTSAEVSDMVSKGKIDFATFEAAMHAGMGGAALKSAETFSGALANAQAALGRLGAAAMGPALTAAKPILIGLTGLIDGITSAVKPAAEALGIKMVGAAEEAGAKLSQLGEIIVGAGDLWNLVTKAFGDAAPVLNFAAALSPLNLAFKALQPVLPQIADAVVQIIKALAPAVPTLASVAAQLAVVAAQIGGQLVTGLAAVLPALIPIVVKLAELAAALLSNEPLVMAVAQAFIGWKLISGVIPLVTGVASSVSGLMAGMKAVTPLISAFGLGVRGGFAPLVGAAKTAQLLGHAIASPGTAMQGFVRIVTDGLAGARTTISAFVSAASTALRGLWAILAANPIGLAIAAVAALTAGLVWFFTQTETGRQAWAAFTDWLAGAWTGLVSIATGVWESIVSGVTGAVSAVTSAWNAVPGLFAGIWASIMSGATGVWTGIVSSASSVATAVLNAWTGFTTALAGIWSGIVTTATTIWASVGPVITAPLQMWVEAFTAVWESIKAIAAAALLMLVGIFTGNGELIASAMQGLSGTLAAIWTTALGNIQLIATNAWLAISGACAAAWAAITATLSSAWAAMVAVVSGGVNTAIAFVAALPGRAAAALSSLGGTITGIASSAWASFTRTVNSGVSQATSYAQQLPGRAASALSALGGLISGIARSAWAAFTSAVSSGISSAISLVASLPGRAASALSGIGGALVGAGGQLIQGLINGITGAAGAIAGKVRGVVEGAIAAAKNALGIHSPSRVFALIGEQTGQGVVQGLAAMEGAVSRAASAMTAAAIPQHPLQIPVDLALADLSSRVHTSVQAKYDAIATRIGSPGPQPGSAATPPPAQGARELHLHNPVFNVTAKDIEGVAALLRFFERLPLLSLLPEEV